MKVDLGKSRGKVSVEFATLDDLRRIVDIIDPNAGPLTDRTSMRVVPPGG